MIHDITRKRNILFLILETLLLTLPWFKTLQFIPLNWHLLYHLHYAAYAFRPREKYRVPNSVILKRFSSKWKIWRPK